MAQREVLSPSQRLRLDALPVDLDERLLARHHTLSEEELALVRRRRGSANRLGFAVMLALLRFPGRPLRPGEGAPEMVARYVASQVGEDPRAIGVYRRRLYSFLPRIRLTDLLVEVGSWCNFSGHFTDLRTGRPCRDRELVYAAVLADGTNLGPTKMAEATDDPRVTYERLAWAADWHVREETYQKAIAEVVNAHYRLPFSQHWGEGRTSSSDGQVFFAGGPKGHRVPDPEEAGQLPPPERPGEGPEGDRKDRALPVRARLVPGPRAQETRERRAEQGRGQERFSAGRLLQPAGRASGPLLRGPAGTSQRADPADRGHRAVERGLPGEGRGGVAGAGGRDSRGVPRTPLAARMGAHHPHGRLPLGPRRPAAGRGRGRLPAPLRTTRLTGRGPDAPRSDHDPAWPPFLNGRFSSNHPFLPILSEAAEYLIRAGVETVGVDYLSVEPFEDAEFGEGRFRTHHALLEAGLTVLEGLVLRGVEPGEYFLVCLPLKLVGSDGSPARAVLIRGLET